MRKTILILFLLAAPAVARDVLPFIENDYSKAVVQARAKDLPLFVDAWAPW